MKLKFIYDKEEDIPAEFKSLFTLSGTKWVLQVDGAVPEAKFEEFRNNNIALLKERDALVEKFKDVDPDQYKTLKTRAELLDEKKLITTEGLDAAVEKRVGTMKTEYEAKLAEATKKLTERTSEIGKLKIDGALTTAGTKAGLRPEAVEDFVRRGQGVFSLDENGNVVAMNGTEKRYNAAGAPLGIDDWVADVAKDKAYAHLFNPSQGSGSQSQGAGAGGGPTQNPFIKNTPHFNLTEQARMIRENPAQASALKAAAAAAAGTPGIRTEGV